MNFEWLLWGGLVWAVAVALFLLLLFGGKRLAGRGEVAEAPHAGRRSDPVDAHADRALSIVDDDARWAKAVEDDDFSMWSAELPARVHKLAARLPERAT